MFYDISSLRSRNIFTYTAPAQFCWPMFFFAEDTLLFVFPKPSASYEWPNFLFVLYLHTHYHQISCPFVGITSKNCENLQEKGEGSGILRSRWTRLMRLLLFTNVHLISILRRIQMYFIFTIFPAKIVWTSRNKVSFCTCSCLAFSGWWCDNSDQIPNSDQRQIRTKHKFGPKF